MKDRYGRRIEIGDEVQFSPEHLGHPDGQVRAIVVDAKPSISMDASQPAGDSITLTFTQTVTLPVGAAALVAVVGKNAEAARVLAQNRGRTLLT